MGMWAQAQMSQIDVRNKALVALSQQLKKPGRESIQYTKTGY